MNLIVDIGNNSSKYYLFNGKQLVLHSRRNNGTSGILSEWNKEFEIEKVIVSSVIDLDDAARKEFGILGCPVLWFNSETPTPLSIDYSTPHTLGSDRCLERGSGT